MVATDLKKRIKAAIEKDREKYPSDARHAKVLDINPSQYSELKKGKLDRNLSDTNWINIARKLDVNPNTRSDWKTARTLTFRKISDHLKACQEESISAILCDIPDIGKTYTAKHYVRNNKNAVYIDCSQVKSKQRFIRKIAKEFGVDSNGKYKDVYENLVYYVRTLDRPLIILDEAGDLHTNSFLEIKALWNAMEYCCGWYMMGADGLRAKIERNVGNIKIGFAEIVSRYGSRFQRVSPEGKESREEFLDQQAVSIAKANLKNVNVKELLAKTQGSARRVYIEIKKSNRKAS